MKRVTVSLPEAMVIRLKTEAQMRGVSLSALVRQKIELAEQLEQAERARRRALRRAKRA